VQGSRIENNVCTIIIAKSNKVTGIISLTGGGRRGLASSEDEFGGMEALMHQLQDQNVVPAMYSQKI